MTLGSSYWEVREIGTILYHVNRKKGHCLYPVNIIYVNGKSRTVRDPVNIKCKSKKRDFLGPVNIM